MPKSNKKKYSRKTPPKSPTHQSRLTLSHLQTYDYYESISKTATAQLLMNETSKMLSRAIKSANFHGINLEPGSSNPGKGDCAFEAVIQNINDRTCFRDKFLMPIPHYRKLWVTEMANRTINSDFNIYTHEEWMEGWKTMLIPGTYERGIFGDLMIPGIACGVRKSILIFNTNENSPHDPIYVVNPSSYNVETDTIVPIVLAYNLVHYESLHPCTESDTQATVSLVRKYLEGRYEFGRQHFPLLLGLENVHKAEPLKIRSEKSDSYSGNNKEVPSTDSFEEQHSKPYNPQDISQSKTEDKLDLDRRGNSLDQNNSIGIIKATISSKNKTEDVISTKLSYTLKDKKVADFIKVENGKMHCPICRNMVKNIKIHFTKIKTCGIKIEMQSFLEAYAK